MKLLLYIIFGIFIPFFGTCLGSCFVFFLRESINNKIHKVMIGFSIGVMLAASVWSLIIPSVEMAKKQHAVSFLPASIGLFLGILSLLLINNYTNRLNNYSDSNKINMLFLSVTIHNIPEGMAVGVCFAGVIANANISLAEAMLLSIGIAIQNIPEGAIISMPFSTSGLSKRKSFMYGLISGIVEPIAAFITIILINFIVPILPYLLSFAAGSMIYVVIEDLIPEMQTDNRSILGIIGVSLGFIIMMILDIVLG